MLKSISILITTLLISQTAHANCEKEVERISECEALLDKADYVINVQAETINHLSTQRDNIEKQLDYVTAELAKEKSWFRDPSIIIPAAFIGGVVTGILITAGSR